MRRGVMALVLLGAVSACGYIELPGSTPAWKPSDTLQRSERMLKALDRLEADLQDARSSSAVYTELVARHGQAQQIACQVTEEHVQEIRRLDLAQQKKREEKKTRKRRVALVHHKKTALASR